MMPILQNKYSKMHGYVAVVPWPPSTKDAEWDRVLSLLCAPHCLIEGDLYDRSQSLSLQGYVAIAVHWLYRKGWKSGHRLTGGCPELWRGIEPLGDLLLVILKVAEAVFNSQEKGFPQCNPPVSHPAQVFLPAAVQMMLIALVSREGKCGKSDHIKELRELTRILRNKANQDSDEEPQNPFSKLHEPELWQLIEAACYINREIATPIPFDLLLHGTPKKKGLLFALTGWIERLEVKGSNWQVVIRDPDYVALIRAFGRGNSLRQIPIIDLETLVSKTHFLKRSPSKGFGR